MPNTLVIKVTAGADSPERCAQAFTIAATAATSGITVSLWLTGEASWFAVAGRAAEFALEGSAPLSDLLDTLLAFGRVTLCTQCAARRGLTQADVLAGIEILGAASFVHEVMQPDTQALVY